MKKIKENIKMYTLFIITVIISIVLFLSFTSSNVNDLQVNQKAPDFKLYNQNAELVSLSDYAGKNLIIYFFPKAFTPGWVKQACGFRDEYKQYRDNNIEILGISYDTKERQKEFSQKYNLSFQLLSDVDAKVSKLYGVDTYFFPKRVTFLIDENGIVFDVIDDMSLGDYAENIIQIFKKHNIKSNDNIKK